MTLASLRQRIATLVDAKTTAGPYCNKIGMVLVRTATRHTSVLLASDVAVSRWAIPGWASLTTKRSAAHASSATRGFLK